MLILKTVLIIICALLLAVCYRAQGFAEKILKKDSGAVTDELILRIKIAALIISIVIFICSIIFVKV